MHYRRLACLLLGFWLGGSAFMAFVATQNFAGVDRLLSAPPAAAGKDIQLLGNARARLLLRHQVSELNRVYFRAWETIQLGLGILLLLTLFFGAGARTSMVVFALLMLAAASLQRWLLTPLIAELGRAIDFAPPDGASAEYGRFRGFHAAYSIIEVIKVFLGVLLTARLLRRRKRSDGVIGELDAVDNADNSHVDGR